MKQILIVDDELNFRLSLAEMLVDQGFKVATAANGVEAIHYLKSVERLPDLITIDINMPLQDGLMFREELLKNKMYQIPLFFISGFFPADFELDGIKAALSKPLNKFELMSAIESHIGI